MPRYRLYVGPCAVREYASKVREDGFADVLEGTAHIYFTSSQDRFQVQRRLYPVLGYVPDLVNHLHVTTPKTGE